jgi:hypothetical protein
LFTTEEQKSQPNIPEEQADAADFMASEDDEKGLTHDEAMEIFYSLENAEVIGEPDETSDEDNDKPVETVEEEELRCGDQPTQEDLDFIVFVDDSREDEEYRPEEDQTSGSASDDSTSSQEEDY